MACEYSGRVREAFRKKGWDAWSCDLLPTEIPGQHIQGDVLDIINDDWDLLIAHPPCTYLANSGAKHLYKGMKKENGPCPKRFKLMREGADFFIKIAKSRTLKKAIENPIMHGHAQFRIKEGLSIKQRLKLFTQIVQPWWFGDKKMKATGLVLQGLPPLKMTNCVGPPPTNPKQQSAEGWNEIHMATPGDDRWKRRSTTFQGFADAMAEQWGELG